MSAHDWHTIVGSGHAADPSIPDVPTGPWHGREAAEAAFNRWCWRVGANAGDRITAHSLRIVGPFCTRADARAADITRRNACPHWD